MIESLDLSLGNLSNDGAQALKELRINHHDATKKLIKQLQKMGLTVDVSSRIEPGDPTWELRWVAVFE